ncbi:hypothetical protein KP509_02G049800 [Ceratopteris richardii]|uniref:F-box domain-containing protein n=1 Tax=Ceratopteris richardii TaxID=49495 RepID=A0A8T2VH24_CERRI|nr:hypothetical protein KP509_02G049800 [Ceratopteris richardii]
MEDGPIHREVSGDEIGLYMSSDSRILIPSLLAQSVLSSHRSHTPTHLHTYTHTDTHRTAFMADFELIPHLPFDIAIDCLLRVPLYHHPALALVCRSWRALVSSSSFLQARLDSAYADHYAGLIQAVQCCQSASSTKIPIYAVSLYNPQSSWSRLPSIPDFPSGLPLFCQCAAVSGKLVIMGGWDPASWGVLRSVHVYDMVSAQWRRGSPMPSSRSFFTCVAIPGGRRCIAVAGGHDDAKNALRRVDVYDVDYDQWREMPDLNEERDECKAVVMDGKLTIVSGYPTESQGQFGSSGEVYDEDKSTWKIVDKMWPSGVSPSSAVTIAGELYACFDGKVMRRRLKDGQWQAVIELPQQIKILACTTSLTQSLFVAGYTAAGSTSIHAFTCSVLAPSWKVVEPASDFSGIFQGACTMVL